MSYDKDYASRLESYIQSENLTRTLYRKLASKCHGETAAILHRMSTDEARHLKAMQMEYYLLTGNTLPTATPKTDGTLQDNLRKAYSGEWGSAEAYTAESGLHRDKALKKLFLAQSEDELRHRRLVKEIVAHMFGG